MLASGTSYSIGVANVTKGLVLMQIADRSGQNRIPTLLEMVRALKHARDPQAVLDLFIQAMHDAFAAACYMAISTNGLAEGSFRVARWRTADGRECVPPADLGHAAHDQPVREGGVIASLLASGSPTLVHGWSAADDAVFGKSLAAYRCAVALPVFEADDSLDWVVLFHSEPEGISHDDVEALLILVNLSRATVNIAHVHERVEHDAKRVHRQVDLIADIQKVLLPATPPVVPGLSLAMSYKSFDRAGGDYYDIFEVRRLPGASPADPRWLIVIADSAGHGAAAAVMMTVFNAVLFTCPLPPDSPAAFLAYLNHHLHERHQAASIVTAILAFYDPATGRMVHANAGHPPPLVRRSGPPVRVEEMSLGFGYPLGLLPTHEAVDCEFTLQRGEMLLLYTDGVPDECDIDDEPFGMDRVAAVLASTSEPQEVVDQLNTELVRHQGATMPEDDQAMVVIRREVS